MTEKWADGAVTLHGFHMHDFPNCFVVSLVQSGFSVNFPHMLDVQARHLGHVLGHVQREGITRIEATEAAEQAWTETIVSLAQMNLGFLEQCTPGYYNNEGRPAERSLRNSSYGAGSGAFAKVLEAWRDAGELEGLELTTAHGRVGRSTRPD